MNRFRLNPLWAIALYLFCLACRTPEEKQLETALQFAGENRSELEKALRYYNPYSSDSLKYRAVHFLIRNMPGCWGPDSSFLQSYKHFYEEYRNLTIRYPNQYPILGQKIDSLWELKRPLLPRLEECGTPDIRHITSDYLIEETGNAFRAWEGNAYCRKCSFEEFCEYILPYRRKNGLIADRARTIFYARHHGHFYHNDSLARQGIHAFVRETDSLLYLYRHITHTHFYGNGIPVPSAPMLEYLGKGLCEHRCWFNSVLLSSLGITTAVDFVPAWGNRNSSHSWNVAIINGQTYAFESFWDTNRWKYKHIYNNKTYDKEWGSFRLPKVYRHTYSSHPTAPATDRRVRSEDVPPLFKNYKKKDVSAEYFDTLNLTLRLPEVPENMYYAYLCVFGYQQWHPVQYGEIRGDKVTFEGMGKDLVYLPAFYCNGEIIPAGAPFHLRPDNSIDILTPRESHQTIAVNHVAGAPFYEKNQQEIAHLAHCRFIGSNTPDFSTADTLGEIPGSVFMEAESIPTDTSCSYRYIRLISPCDTFAAGDIRFYTANQSDPLPSRILHCNYTPLSSADCPEHLTDGFAASCFKGKIRTDTPRFIDFDLGKAYRLIRIGYSLCITNGIMPDAEYELFYWQGNDWHSCGKQKSGKGWLHFTDVPSHALYQLRNCNWNKRIERIFTYDNNETRWK